MEQPCYKCRQPVGEGVAFCPHCGAPQIRVILPEPAPALAAATDAASSDAATLPASHTAALLTVPMVWSDTFRPAVLAALIACVLMSMGLNPFVAMVCVGFLAVLFYRQRRPEALVTAIRGAAIGAIGGLLWFAISTIFGAVIVLVLHQGGAIRTQLVEKLEQAASQTQDTQVQAILERFKSPDGLEALMIAGFFFGLLAALFLGGLGGAIGGALFGRRNRR